MKTMEQMLADLKQGHKASLHPDLVIERLIDIVMQQQRQIDALQEWTDRQAERHRVLSRDLDRIRGTHGV